jgi:predicted glycogen debranching enzyme
LLDFGRDVCGHLPVAERREWLVTNGIGGYGSGTVAGLLTRRYHGLLIAAQRPPLGRTLLVTKLDETATYDGGSYPLFANRWVGGKVEPAGFDHVERFHLEGTTPVWTFACADALLEKRVWMQVGANTTCVRYDLGRASAPLTLIMKALVNYRGHHGNTQADDWQMGIRSMKDGLRVTAFEGARPFYLLSDRAKATALHDWYRGFFLRVEDYRGLEGREDHLQAGGFGGT